MGYHADDEPELGENPVIASLSFGAGRLFKMQHKRQKPPWILILGHGDLNTTGDMPYLKPSGRPGLI